MVVFEQRARLEKWIERAGFLFSYFVFTTILYGILTILNKSHGLNFINILIITFLITILGLGIKRFLR